MAYITTCCIIVFVIQSIRQRLLTGTSLWVAFYFCFFVLSPIILGGEDQLASLYAKEGITAFLVSYIISISIITIKEKRYKNVDLLSTHQYLKINCNLIEKYSRFLLRLTIVFLLLGIGINGIKAVVQGQLTSSLISENSNIFITLFDFAREFYGYCLILYVVGNKGKFTKSNFIHLCIFALLTILFSFTRVSLLYILLLLAIYLMRKKKLIKQIMIMIVLGLSGAVLMSVMMVIRTFGINQVFQRFNIMYFLNSLGMSIDFTRIYLSFVELIHNPVRITPLVYLKPIFILIPRSLWIDKPYASAVEIFRQLHYADWQSGISTGYALIGEAFAVMGNLGVVLYPAIFGGLLPFLDSKYVRYIKTNNDDSLVCFFYLYFANVFILQSFRHGTDIALMYLPLYFIAFWAFNKFRFSFGNGKL